MCVSNTWGLPIRKLNIITLMPFCPSHMRSFSICAFSSPLYASIWLKMWPCWIAWLLYLCPTFPLILLGHKGDCYCRLSRMCTSDWVKPKASVLKGIFSRWTKDVFVYYNLNPQKFSILRSCSQSGHVHRRMRTQGKEPLTELFSLEDVSYYPCNIT